MAINLLAQYPGKVDPVTAAWPYGKPRNITVSGDGLGTPWEAAIIKDIVGLQQALLTSSGIVPSGTPDEVGTSEYLQSLVELASGRAETYTTSGTADNIVLTAFTNQEPVQSLYVGLTVKFTPIASNTGAVFVNLVGLGVKSIKDIHSNTLRADDLVVNIDAIITYDGVDFIHTNPIGTISGTFTPGMYGSTTGTGVRPTYSTQLGSWVRQGDILFVKFSVIISALSGMTGNIILDGFPYDIDEVIPSGVWSFTIIQGNNFTMTTNYNRINLIPSASVKILNVKQKRDIDGAGSDINLTDAELSAGAFFQFGGFYRIK